MQQRQFLEEVRNLPQKNLALGVLRKLLNDEIRSRSRRNVVQSRTFCEMLENSIRRYQLRKHGYPPDKQENATQTVIRQAEELYQNWAV